MNQPYEIIGANPSPFSRKLRAILRYRRLPHVWRLRGPDMGPAIEAVRPRLIPILGIPADDGSMRYAVDTTPLAHELEARHPGARSIVPPDPAAAFLCHLIEDMADEWFMQAMYYFRWVEDDTGRFAARWIIRERAGDVDAPTREMLEREVFTRQRGRMDIVCGGASNGAIIESHYRELLRMLAPLATQSRYLFGTRPSLADFALYGQLSELVTDPLPQRIAREIAPSVELWVMQLDDASGVEGEWVFNDEVATETRRSLLRLAARGYFPFMAANAAAVAASRETFEAEVDGHAYRRSAYGYQARCSRELLAHWQALSISDRGELEALLGETGCLRYLNVAA
ncbi:MAG TPA: glutathione S-transferase N-terminal domain-containing protein [Candidatus Limnocylindrales bacterium]|nr:glutathione S-transferase N-terminal domain-containing protein [Candidatus Limnocylindrales bacterium]